MSEVLDDPEVLALFADRDADPRAREALVLRFEPLAEYLARRFAGRGEPLEDLTQVATLGLLSAIDRFDPDREVRFTTFAAATIVGELKRYLRDKAWELPERFEVPCPACLGQVRRIRAGRGHPAWVRYAEKSSPAMLKIRGHDFD